MRQSIKISVQPMKKILMMVALMAMTLTVSAQDVKTYEFEKFTAVYPADFELNMVWGECWGFKIGDDHLYEVVIDPYCTTLNGLKDYGDYRKESMEEKGFKCDEPVVQGNTVYVRGVNGNQVHYDFAVKDASLPEEEAFRGFFYCLTSDEAKYKPIFLEKLLPGLKLKK